MTWREGQEEKEYFFEVYYNLLLFLFSGFDDAVKA